MRHRHAIHVATPIAIGTAIYLAWRSESLLAFALLKWANLHTFIPRPTVSPPAWFLFSLPDGCWVYSGTLWMHGIWNRYVIWTFAAVTLAIGGELGQLIGCVPGSYDHRDILFYLLGFICAGVVHAKTS